MKKRSTAKSDKSIKISSHEFSHHNRNQFWYIGVSVLLLAFLLLTIYSGDYLLSVVVIVSALAIFRLGGLKPVKKDIELTDSQVMWGDENLAYHNFRAFWVGTHDGQYTVYLERLNYKPAISFEIEDKQVEDVLDILSCQLPFHLHRNTPLPDRLSKFLKI